MFHPHPSLHEISKKKNFKEHFSAKKDFGKILAFEKDIGIFQVSITYHFRFE
jgi:hypothetical protein